MSPCCFAANKTLLGPPGRCGVPATNHRLLSAIRVQRRPSRIYLESQVRFCMMAHAMTDFHNPPAQYTAGRGGDEKRQRRPGERQRSWWMWFGSLCCKRWRVSWRKNKKHRYKRNLNPTLNSQGCIDDGSWLQHHEIKTNSITEPVFCLEPLRGRAVNKTQKMFSGLSSRGQSFDAAVRVQIRFLWSCDCLPQ